VEDIKEVKFDLQRRSFEITSVNGTVIRYPNFSQEDYDRMVTSENLQRAIEQKIHDGKTVGILVSPVYKDEGLVL
jgi:hypothetical protein